MVLLAISREFGKSVDWLLTGEGKKGSCVAGSRSPTLRVQLELGVGSSYARFLGHFACAWRQGFPSAPGTAPTEHSTSPAAQIQNVKEESRFERDG